MSRGNNRQRRRYASQKARARKAFNRSCKDVRDAEADSIGLKRLARFECLTLDRDNRHVMRKRFNSAIQR